MVVSLKAEAGAVVQEYEVVSTEPSGETVFTFLPQSSYSNVVSCSL